MKCGSLFFLPYQTMPSGSNCSSPSQICFDVLSSAILPLIYLPFLFLPSFCFSVLLWEAIFAFWNSDILYKPNSKLNIISKLFKRVAINSDGKHIRLQFFLLLPFKSAYRKCHFTETALQYAVRRSEHFLLNNSPDVSILKFPPGCSPRIILPDCYSPNKQNTRQDTKPKLLK